MEPKVQSNEYSSTRGSPNRQATLSGSRHESVEVSVVVCPALAPKSRMKSGRNPKFTGRLPLPHVTNVPVNMGVQRHPPATQNASRKSAGGQI